MTRLDGGAARRRRWIAARSRCSATAYRSFCRRASASSRWTRAARTRRRRPRWLSAWPIGSISTTSALRDIEPALFAPDDLAQARVRAAAGRGAASAIPTLVGDRRARSASPRCARRCSRCARRARSRRCAARGETEDEDVELAAALVLGPRATRIAGGRRSRRTRRAARRRDRRATSEDDVAARAGGTRARSGARGRAAAPAGEPCRRRRRAIARGERRQGGRGDGFAAARPTARRAPRRARAGPAGAGRDIARSGPLARLAPAAAPTTRAG